MCIKSIMVLWRLTSDERFDSIMSRSADCVTSIQLVIKDYRSYFRL